MPGGQKTARSTVLSSQPAVSRVKEIIVVCKTHFGTRKVTRGRLWELGEESGNVIVPARPTRQFAVSTNGSPRRLIRVCTQWPCPGFIRIGIDSHVALDSLGRDAKVEGLANVA